MDAELETLIDEAGREKVFARARAHGWSPGDAVPTWVWRQMAHEVKTGLPLRMASPPPRMDEVLLGFRLL